MKWATIALVLALAGCTNESAARQTLRSMGFTEVRTTGWAPMSCSDDDFSRTKFVAKNAQGVRVHGVVCCGLVFKDCTVRF